MISHGHDIRTAALNFLVSRGTKFCDRRRFCRQKYTFRPASDAIDTLVLEEPVVVEGYLVFRDPVAMKYAWERLSERVR